MKLRLSKKTSVVVSAELAMIERLAIDPNVTIDKVEMLMARFDRLRKEADEARFNDAMRAAQAGMTRIAADSDNPQTHSKYASYAALDRAIRPIYTEAGFSISFDQADTAPTDHIRVVAIVANGPFARTYHYDSPIVTKGFKDTTMMTLTHARASAVTYAKRYLLTMVFNLAVGDVDDDGNSAGKVPLTEEQVAALEKLLVDTKVSVTGFMGWVKKKDKSVKKLADIDTTFFDSCVEAIQQAAAGKVAK